MFRNQRSKSVNCNINDRGQHCYKKNAHTPERYFLLYFSFVHAVDDSPRLVREAAHRVHLEDTTEKVTPARLFLSNY